MSNYDNGFAEAQRQYDNQMPPEDEDIETAERIQEAYEEYMERKSDEAREESLRELGIIGSDIDRYLDKHIEE